MGQSLKKIIKDARGDHGAMGDSGVNDFERGGSSEVLAGRLSATQVAEKPADEV